MDGGAEVSPLPLRYSRGPIQKATWEPKVREGVLLARTAFISGG